MIGCLPPMNILPGCLGFFSVSRSIGEPLADDTLEGIGRPFGIVHAKGNPVVVSEVELGKVAVQMLLADMVEGAGDAALQDREVTLDGVGVNVATDIFLDAVVDGLMAEVPVHMAVLPSIVGDEQGLVIDLGHEDRAESGRGNAGDVMRTDVTIALDQGEDSLLTPTATELLGGALAPMPVLLLAADEGLVGFDGLALSTKRTKATFLHGFADAMRHEPSGLEGNAQGPVKLVGADALLAGANKVDRDQPITHGDMAGLEDGPDLDGKGLAARIALVEPDPVGLALEFARPINRAAMRADAPIRPDMRLDVGVSGGFIVEVCGGKDRLGHD